MVFFKLKMKCENEMQTKIEKEALTKNIFRGAMKIQLSKTDYMYSTEYYMIRSGTLNLLNAKAMTKIESLRNEDTEQN